MAYLAIKSRYKANLVFAVLIAVICCLKLLFLERWLVDNDNYATLGTFFLKAKDPQYLNSARLFNEAAVGSCPAHDTYCIAYAGAVFGEQTYARPITAYFGSSLAQAKWLASEVRFLEGITRATVLLVVVSTVVLVALLLCFLLLLPRPVSEFIAGVTALLGTTMYWLPEHTAYGHFQPLLGLNIDGAMALFVFTIAVWLYARSAPDRFRDAWESLSSDRLIRFLWIAALSVFALRVVAAKFPALDWGGQVFGSRVGLLTHLLLFAGLGVFLAAVTAAVVRERAEFDVIWVSLLLLFGFAVGTVFFTSMFGIASRGHIFLLAGPIFIYIALHPNGRALWLLPGLLLFHVSVAGLFYGCIVATETVMAVRRRSVSLALILSGVLLIAAIAHTVITSGNPATVSGSPFVSLVIVNTGIWSWIPGAMVMLILAYAGYVTWRMPHHTGELLLRAVVLAALLAGAGQMREALQAAGYAIVDPDAFMFVLLSRYLAPIVCSAGTFLVLFALATSGRPFVAPQFVPDGKTMSLLAAGVLALAMARSGNNMTRPSDPLAAIAQGGRLVATQGLPARIDPLVMEAAAPNDRYLVGYFPADATSMMSILKMKCRSAAGLLDQGKVSIAVAKRGSTR